jgi:hypothetical protein
VRPYLQHGIQRHTPSGSDPIRTDPWWFVGEFGNADPWAAETTYSKGDTVSDLNSIGVVSPIDSSVFGSLANWISLQDNNQGNDPLNDGNVTTSPSFWMCYDVHFLDVGNLGDAPNIAFRLIVGPPWDTDGSTHLAFKGVAGTIAYPGGISPAGTAAICWLPYSHQPQVDRRLAISDTVDAFGCLIWTAAGQTVNILDPTGAGAGHGWWCDGIF